MNKVARKMASMPPAYIQTVQEKGKNIENRIYTSCSLGNFHRIIIIFFLQRRKQVSKQNERVMCPVVEWSVMGIIIKVPIKRKSQWE